jgi:BirA family transcriptional regulator, biotin operon repressor / biotin---[acetyl-CoA-carboxylase] ligase
VGPREHYTEVASTQDRAVALAKEGAEAGTRVVADRQTRGRGRLDHLWESPEGGLYVSVVLPAPSDHLSLLPLALGARLAEALGRRYQVPIRLRWPNDLIVPGEGGASGRKLAGILVDHVPSPRFGTAAVAGVGVNVRADPREFPPPVRARSTSLAELAPPPVSLEEVEEIVVRRALEASARLRDAQGAEETRTLCRRLLYGVGRRATVDGRELGTVAALGDEGELWLDAGTHRVAIRAGDLRLEEPT